MSNGNEIIVYQPDSSVSIEVKVENETVWLTQAQMTELFQSTKQNISLHINNVFKEGELDKESTVKEYLTVQTEGLRKVQRKIAYYNLDVIISVGYRVKSKRGTDFRIWATKILKEYLINGYALNKRIERLEYRMTKSEETIGFLVSKAIPPKEGIFFDGQIFDAYVLMNDLIRSAQKRIVLIDNYVDDSILPQLNKRKENVEVTIFTTNKNKGIVQDLKKYNAQYPTIHLRQFERAHDRFLIIDETVYHIGASLKDLGKKLFAFSKMEETKAEELLTRIGAAR